MRRAVGLLLETLDRLRPAVIITIAGLLVALVVLGNYLIPVGIRFSFFYLVPVAMTAWFVGPRAGTVFSVLGAAAGVLESVVENGFGNPGSVVIYANGVLLLGFFLLLSRPFSALRAALGCEKAAARVDAVSYTHLRAHETRH